jgi:hypothetical protein
VPVLMNRIIGQIDGALADGLFLLGGAIDAIEQGIYPSEIIAGTGKISGR